MITTLDGTVVSSSQTEFDDWLADKATPIFHGIILEVRPCDSDKNYSALNAEDFRGHRHECKVLASDYIGREPDLIITNVIIPPDRHSGIDDFDEDLPRGTTGTIDGSHYSDDLRKVDYTKLDGEWCLVGFVGGNIENPFIIGWWPHPANKYDLITSGNKTFGEDLKKTSLAQFDTKSGKSRFLRRVNGTVMMVTKNGSVYLDTSEANSTVKIVNGKYTRTLVDKGGDFQFDLAPKAQLEVNFNEKDHKNPRIGVRSNSQEPQTDVELPHPDQPVTGDPKPRETKRTYIRGKEYELLLKTSNFSIFCEKVDGEEDGEFIVQAHDGVTIAQQPSGGIAATMSIRDGKIQLVAADGTQINILSDEVQIVSKGGSVISLKGSVATVSAATIALGGAVAVSGAMSISDGNPATPTEAALKGDTYLSELTTLLTAIKAYLTAAGTAWPTTAAPTGSVAGGAATSAGTAIDTFLAKKGQFTSTTTKMA